MSDRPDRPVSILLVDDNPAFLDMMAALLERSEAPFSIATATSGQAALDYLPDDDIGCVLSAYELPAMTGIDLAGAVSDLTPDAAFVLVSNADPSSLQPDPSDVDIDARYRKMAAVENYPKVARRIHDLACDVPSDRKDRRIAPER